MRFIILLLMTVSALAQPTPKKAATNDLFTIRCKADSEHKWIMTRLAAIDIQLAKYRSNTTRLTTLQHLKMTAGQSTKPEEQARKQLNAEASPIAKERADLMVKKFHVEERIRAGLPKQPVK